MSLLRRIRPPVLVLLLVAVVPGLPACAVHEAGSAKAAPNSWHPVPAGPLGARENGIGVWTGAEALIVGGSDAPPCPPNAGCLPAQVAALRDGAAFDPRSGSWRRIAAAPVGLESAEGIAVIGRTVFLLTAGDRTRPGTPRALLAYSADRDRWRRLTPPRRAGASEEYGLVAAGRRLVAYRGREALVHGRRSGAWRALPPAPLPGAVEQMVWTPHGLVAFSCAERGTPSEPRCLTTAAVLDLAAGRWRRLPDSTLQALPTWVADGDRVVNAGLGFGGFGAVDPPQSARAFPNGGILDLPTGRWSALPQPPSDHHWEGGAVLTASALHYGSPGTWAFDTTDDHWIRIPAQDGGQGATTGRTDVATGRGVLTFGGVRWSGRRPRFVRGARLWEAPSP